MTSGKIRKVPTGHTSSSSPHPHTPSLPAQILEEWVLSLRSGSKFPDSTQIIQINQNNLWPRVPPLSFYYKASLLQSLFLYSVLGWNPFVALHNIHGPTLWGCEYLWRINCHLSHLIHIGLFGLKILPLPWGEQLACRTKDSAWQNISSHSNHEAASKTF